METRLIPYIGIQGLDRLRLACDTAGYELRGLRDRLSGGVPYIIGTGWYTGSETTVGGDIVILGYLTNGPEVPAKIVRSNPDGFVDAIIGLGAEMQSLVSGIAPQ